MNMNQFDEAARQAGDPPVQGTVSAAGPVLPKGEDDLPPAERILQQTAALHQQHGYHPYYPQPSPVAQPTPQYFAPYYPYPESSTSTSASELNRSIVTSAPSEVEIQGTPRRGEIRGERGGSGGRDEANGKKRARASDQEQNFGHEDVAEVIEVNSEASRPRTTGRNRSMKSSEKLHLIRLCVANKMKYRPNNKGNFWTLLSDLLKNETEYILKQPRLTIEK